MTHGQQYTLDDGMDDGSLGGPPRRDNETSVPPSVPGSSALASDKTSDGSLGTLSAAENEDSSQPWNDFLKNGRF